MSRKADEYRAEADLFLHDAAATLDPEARRALEELAREWLELALQIEEQEHSDHHRIRPLHH